MNRNARHKRHRQSLRSQMRELQRASFDVLRSHGHLPGPFYGPAPEAHRQRTLATLASLLPGRRPR